MLETEAELEDLQALIDRSYAAAGQHLLRIHTPERRLDAVALAARLTGMRLLSLATVTADGRPVVGPVDGVFLHGAFHFGSAPDSTRFTHIRARPHVSATHLPGEELAVTVHGRAVEVDTQDAELRAVLTEIYGAKWIADILDKGSAYARIDAEKIFAFHMDDDD